MNRIKAINWLFLFEMLIAYFGSAIRGIMIYFTSNELIIMICYHIILILPAVIFLAANHINPLKQINLKPIKIGNIFLLILFAYMITPFIGVINSISMVFVKNSVQDTITNVVTQYPLVLGIIAIAVVPAIFEEALYRGLFYNEYKKASLRKGILLSAVLFGLAHRNINQFLYAFVMGIIFSLLIEATDSILAAMIVHFVFNADSVSLSHLFQKLPDSLYNAAFDQSLMYTSAELIYTAGFVITTTVLAFIIFRAIAKNSGRYEHVKKIIGIKAKGQKDGNGYGADEISLTEMGESKQRLITIPLVLGMIFCVYLMIMYEIT